MPTKTWLILFLDERVVCCILKALVIELEGSFSMRSSETYAGMVVEIDIWEIFFLLVKNCPILTFSKCYAILQVSWADTVVGWKVLWSIYTKLRGAPAENWCCGLQVKVLTNTRDCCSKPEESSAYQRLLSWDCSTESEWHQRYLTLLCAKCKND